MIRSLLTSPVLDARASHLGGPTVMGNRVESPTQTAPLGFLLVAEREPTV